MDNERDLPESNINGSHQSGVNVNLGQPSAAIEVLRASFQRRQILTPLPEGTSDSDQSSPQSIDNENFEMSQERAKAIIFMQESLPALLNLETITIVEIMQILKRLSGFSADIFVNLKQEKNSSIDARKISPELFLLRLSLALASQKNQLEADPNILNQLSEHFGQPFFKEFLPDSKRQAGFLNEHVRLLSLLKCIVEKQTLSEFEMKLKIESPNDFTYRLRLRANDGNKMLPDSVKNKSGLVKPSENVFRKFLKNLQNIFFSQKSYYLLLENGEGWVIDEPQDLVQNPNIVKIFVEGNLTDFVLFRNTVMKKKNVGYIGNK